MRLIHGLFGCQVDSRVCEQAAGAGMADEERQRNLPAPVQ